ncbi:cyclic nucleotide-binding domain-containing protein [Terrilactibacillus sp. BCM23-1]|uniref:Cyclic nucleotide-binding domain-containing protein n=1 Tax=Terrilactibacillus tamarindi TaxID=2599694 RepID=A0A6N8CMQ2_9BACI|nr:Crp/Fnr family transcriptional regulator [Terrilactibacillus tamarindi]MTT31349.1 cyclic nucleotide-binding domain-containing protein [Terrilactibacillus tamarindi]
MKKVILLIHLRPIGWLEGLSEASVQEIETKGIIKEFHAKESIFLNGEKLTHYYFVIKGSVAIYKQNEEGKKWIASLLSEGEFFPHVGFNQTKSVYPGNAEALSDSVLFVLSKQQMNTLFNKYPTIHEHLTLFLTVKNQELMTRFSNSVLETASDQLISLLKRLASESGEKVDGDWILIEHGMTVQNMAEYIGVTQETISRILHQLYRDNKAKKAGQKKICVNLKLLKS